MNDIQKIVELYFTSTYHADIPGMKQAFHPNAQITGNFKGQYVDWNLEQFIERIQSKPSAALEGDVYDKKIIAIDLTDTAAIVKAQVVVGGIVFTDYITLLKINEKWIIRNKSFYAG